MPRSARGRVARFVGAIAAASVLAAAAGCGGGDDASAVGAVTQPGAAGTLSWALAGRPTHLDPLTATTRADQLVARQIYEPLIERVVAPYGEGAHTSGLAKARPFAGGTIWHLRLRKGVRFQDGTPFDARAVLANARRWQTVDSGQELVPGLVAVDAPRPDLVRIVLDRPQPHFDRTLSSPRLAIVSPRALAPRSGEGAVVSDAGRSGSGPFELRERSRDLTLVVRNVDWWGSGRDLGPALDQVEFRVVERAAERYRLLHAGDVQVAEALSGDELDQARHDPLLTALPSGNGTALGLERSVRGIDSGTQIPSLSPVWLTRIGSG